MVYYMALWISKTLYILENNRLAYFLSLSILIEIKLALYFCAAEYKRKQLLSNRQAARAGSYAMPQFPCKKLKILFLLRFYL